jgi:hypothetical protein
MVIALIALTLAIATMSRARRTGSSRPRGAILATIVGTISCGFSGLVLIGFAMYWPQLSQYSNCLSGAGTVAAQQACQQQLDHSIGTQVGILGG